MFKDIFEIIEYFHKNMDSNMKLDIRLGTGLTDPPEWITELVAHDVNDEWSHKDDKVIVIIEEKDVSEAITFLRRLNNQHEAN